MTREDIIKILGESATDEQISALLDKAHANDSNYKKQIEDLKVENGKYKDYDAIKSKLSEMEKSKMSKEEQLAAREKAIAEKEKETNLRENKSIAKEILSSYNLSDEVINSMVSDDAEKTRANSQALANQLTSIREATIKATKEELININAKPNPSNNQDSGMTFEKFNEMSAEEQNKFVIEHPDEFSRL